MKLAVVPAAAPTVVATDGSARGRHCGSAWLSDAGGWWLQHFVMPRWGRGDPLHASLHAELIALVAAVTCHPPVPLLLRCDSQDAVRLVSAWLAGELRPVPGVLPRAFEHKVDRFRRLAAGWSHVRVQWVRGHALDPLNEGADALARLASRAGLDQVRTGDAKRRAVGLAAGFVAAHRDSSLDNRDQLG